MRFSLNVWCGILDDTIIGPIFIDGNLRHETYLNILRNELEEILDNLPLRKIRNLQWFQQDGAGPHNARAIQDYLNQRFPNSWMGTFGPVRWPPRSPCFNPLDYFLWGAIKDKVYYTPVADIEELRQRVITSIRSLSPESIRAAVNEMEWRMEACIQNGGAHFEQFR